MIIDLSGHAKQRLWERYRLVSTPGFLWHVGKSLELARPPTAETEQEWAVGYRGRSLRLVYNPRARRVITFNPSRSRRDARGRKRGGAPGAFAPGSVARKEGAR